MQEIGKKAVIITELKNNLVIPEKVITSLL